MLMQVFTMQWLKELEQNLIINNQKINKKWQQET